MQVTGLQNTFAFLVVLIDTLTSGFLVRLLLLWA
jgi:hypothetical protein